MPTSTADILNILSEYNIRPGEDEWAEISLPAVGHIEEGDAVYSTSVADLQLEAEGAEGDLKLFELKDERIQNWYAQFEKILDGGPNAGWEWLGKNNGRGGIATPPEPHCAWYAPMHFFGHGWGIYLREDCILSHALFVAARVDWADVRAPRTEWARQLLRTAFYSFVLHEFFHHKVESLGLRLLVATGVDRYRPYKSSVYRPSFNTRACLEESLANADSYNRLNEPHFSKRVDPAIRIGLRKHLYFSFNVQPPGYAQAINFLDKDSFTLGLYNLQSQVLHGVLQPPNMAHHWAVAPNMITSLLDLTDEIYVILPQGAQPLFKPASIDPGPTVSSNDLINALGRHYGYQQVQGGKGSHVKLAKPNAPTLIIPGNRPVLSPGVVKQALGAIGGHPLSSLPLLLRGQLKVIDR
jgi:predicted RNA binding protein YcfA (HicA-like mRNA interferase family)